MKTPNIHPSAFIAPNATVLGDVTVGEQSSFFFGAVARSEFVPIVVGKRIYHAGDTALHADMALLAEEAIDAALLPIGDVYTMGPADALRAARMIAPKLVIPMHYNTFPAIEQDAHAFAASVTAAGLAAKVLAAGETAEV